MRPWKVYKTDTGYTYNGSLLSCCMYWDEYGTYLGQEQINCMGEEPEVLFFPTSGDEERVRLSLTKEEMENAIT